VPASPQVNRYALTAFEPAWPAIFPAVTIGPGAPRVAPQAGGWRVHSAPRFLSMRGCLRRSREGYQPGRLPFRRGAPSARELRSCPSADTRSIPPDSFAALPLPPLQDERAKETSGSPSTACGRFAASVAAIAKPTRSLEKSSAASNSPGPSNPIDATWYTACDIDSIPRAGAPLEFALPEGTGDRIVRLLLWLRIDEHGEVVEVSAGEPGIPAGWVDAARASLAAIRFTPARKDERAVRAACCSASASLRRRPGTRDWGADGHRSCPSRVLY
jgi:hypothetical protein